MGRLFLLLLLLQPPLFGCKKGGSGGSAAQRAYQRCLREEYDGIRRRAPVTGSQNAALDEVTKRAVELTCQEILQVCTSQPKGDRCLALLAQY